MADRDLFLLDVNHTVKGDDSAGFTITLGQQVTNPDSVALDIPFTNYTVNGQRTVFKNNYAATVAPTATDDAAAGYEVGSQWFDTTADRWYVCLDATATSAVWITAGTLTVNGTPAVDQLCLWNTATEIKGTSDWTYDGTTHTIADAKNFSFNATTGTKIGTATGQKIGFWNVTPIIQPAAAGQADQGAMTSVGANTGTAGAGLTLIGDTSTVNQASNIMDDFVALQEDIAALDVLLTEVRTALVNSGIMKGAA